MEIQFGFKTILLFIVIGLISGAGCAPPDDEKDSFSWENIDGIWNEQDDAYLKTDCKMTEDHKNEFLDTFESSWVELLYDGRQLIVPGDTESENFNMEIEGKKAYAELTTTSVRVIDEIDCRLEQVVDVEFIFKSETRAKINYIFNISYDGPECNDLKEMVDPNSFSASVPCKQTVTTSLYKEPED